MQGRERSRSNIETYNRRSPQKNAKKQISIDVEQLDHNMIALAGRSRSKTSKVMDEGVLEVDESISMNEIVTSRKEEPEYIEDDVTTNRDGINDTYDNRDAYKSAERVKGPGLQSYMRSAGGKRDSAKAGTFKHMVQTPQVGGTALNQTQKSHTSIGDDSNYENEDFESVSMSKSMGTIGFGLGAKQGSFGTHTGGTRAQ